MGQIESSDRPLQPIYQILSEKYTALYFNLKLRLAVKVLNNTAGQKGLVPSLLVFITFPSLGKTSANLIEQEDRFRAMHTAPVEAAKMTAELRI